MSDARIGRGDRVTIIGRTGSGKSVLLRRLLGGYSRAVLIDAKGRAQLDGWPIVYGAREFARLWPRVPRVVARPDPGGDRLAWFEHVCRSIYMTTETAVGIDEVVGIATAAAPPRWLDAILTQGRELGITALVASQRPRRIPVTILSEADHLFVFALNTRDDRDAVRDVIGDYPNPPAGSYRFVYWRGDLTSPIECRPIEPPRAAVRVESGNGADYPRDVRQGDDHRDRRDGPGAPVGEPPRHQRPVEPDGLA